MLFWLRRLSSLLKSLTDAIGYIYALARTCMETISANENHTRGTSHNIYYVVKLTYLVLYDIMNGKPNINVTNAYWWEYIEIASKW